MDRQRRRRTMLTAQFQLKLGYSRVWPGRRLLGRPSPSAQHQLTGGDRQNISPSQAYSTPTAIPCRLTGFAAHLERSRPIRSVHNHATSHSLWAQHTRKIPSRCRSNNVRHQLSSTRRPNQPSITQHPLFLCHPTDCIAGRRHPTFAPPALGQILLGKPLDSTANTPLGYLDLKVDGRCPAHPIDSVPCKGPDWTVAEN